MNRPLNGLSICLFICLLLAALPIVVTAAPGATAARADCPALLQHRFAPLRGGAPESLCRYAGKVLLIVNTASYCGYTKQYESLQALYDRYRDKGLVVLGFPANDFGRQEPGSAEEIADFCERTFKVKFPMMAKTSVIEGGGNALYEALAAASGQRPRWNFHKYLVSRDGKDVASFDSKTDPLSAELTTLLERQLAR